MWDWYWACGSSILMDRYGYLIGLFHKFCRSRSRSRSPYSSVSVISPASHMRFRTKAVFTMNKSLFHNIIVLYCSLCAKQASPYRSYSPRRRSVSRSRSPSVCSLTLKVIFGVDYEVLIANVTLSSFGWQVRSDRSRSVDSGYRYWEMESLRHFMWALWHRICTSSLAPNGVDFEF